MSATDLQLPPNASLLTTVTPTKGQIISPSPQTTVQPLPPTVSAQFNEGFTTITVQGTVLIDAGADISTLAIYQCPTTISRQGNTPVATLELYTVYNYMEEVPTAVFPYAFSFEVNTPPPPGSGNQPIVKVELFLWDEDPVGSRGTTTTVKPPQ
jgi:hypothetical protein